MRGVSFNSTGKALNERDDDSSMSHPYKKKGVIIDKATLEAEKEQERIKKERERNMQSEPVIMNQGYLGASQVESDGTSMIQPTFNNRPTTK